MTAPSPASAPRRVRTTCPYCAVQCNFELTIENNLPVKASPVKDCPVAHGTVCKKGLAALNDLRHDERLTAPLLRVNGELVAVSWTVALDYLRSALRPLAQATPERIGVFGSGALTNEKTYLLGKLARVALRTPNIDYNGRYCMSSASAALNKTFGFDRGLGFPLEEVGHSDLILLFGANIAETLPPMMQYLKAAKDRGAIIYNIDPRATVTAKVAGRHLGIRAGSDAALALGILRLLEVWGKILPTAPAENMEAVLDAARQYTPGRVAYLCGISEDEVLILARAYAAARRPLILTGRGAEQHAHGTDTVQALINLSFLAGHFGKPGAGYAPLTGQGNGQGGREHGQKNDQLPGARHLANPIDRAHMAAFWNMAEADLPQPGYSAQELLNACGQSAEQGGIEALIVLGSNPVVSAAGAGQITERLKSLKHLIVIDVLPSETARLATLVLPGSMWCEEDGTTTNLEGRVQRRRKAAEVPGLAREDWQILCLIAEAVGRPEGFEYADFAELQTEFLRSTAGGKADYSGLSAQQLDAGSAQWPIPASGQPSPHAYAPPYRHVGGQARLRVPEVPSRVSSGLTLTTGRHANQYQSGTQTRRNPGLKASFEVQLHPDTAREYGLKAGEAVTLKTAHGELTLPVAFAPGLRPDTVFIPFHWPGANALTDPELLDPHSKMPAFKTTAVTLWPVRVNVPEARRSEKEALSYGL
ncbi:molybdopterin oxidoreductase family protein [Deinococcus sp.]|uniref:molybdopterin oxidoreductase family protein n=1 Tax=Deinococcus sp. TaxID=47478 RepID=UPI003B5A0195